MSVAGGGDRTVIECGLQIAGEHVTVGAVTACCENHGLCLDGIKSVIALSLDAGDSAVFNNQLLGLRTKQHLSIGLSYEVTQALGIAGAAAFQKQQTRRLEFGTLLNSAFRTKLDTFANQPVNSRTDVFRVNIQNLFVIEILTVAQHIFDKLLRRVVFDAKILL